MEKPKTLPVRAGALDRVEVFQVISKAVLSTTTLSLLLRRSEKQLRQSR